MSWLKALQRIAPVTDIQILIVDLAVRLQYLGVQVAVPGDVFRQPVKQESAIRAIALEARTHRGDGELQIGIGGGLEIPAMNQQQASLLFVLVSHSWDSAFLVSLVFIFTAIASRQHRQERAGQRLAVLELPDDQRRQHERKRDHR